MVDTVITLTNGQTFTVTQSYDDVLEEIRNGGIAQFDVVNEFSRQKVAVKVGAVAAVIEHDWTRNRTDNHAEAAV